MKSNHIFNTHIIDSSQEGPTVLIIAGVHGDEYEPMISAHYLTTCLNNQLTKGKVIIVPVVNPAALNNSDRFASDNLDLARVCPGLESGSITEKYAFQISELIKHSDFLIDMHTGGLTYEIHPMVGYMLVDNEITLKKQQNIAIASKLPLIWGTDCKPNGRTLSIARDYNIPALYFENGGGSGFRNQVVTEYTRAVLNILNHLDMYLLPDEQEIFKYKYWTEDYRVDSGHLQIKMPAPENGIFISEIEIGDIVEKNQVFGKIIDPISGNTVEVMAPSEGLVFLLRTKIYVHKGDALGGIIEISENKKKVIRDEK